MNIEETPEEILSLPVAVVGGGMIAAILGTVLLFPLIDRFIRNRFRLNRGQALSLLLASAFVCWGLGSALTYALLHDDPRYRPSEEEGDAAIENPASDTGR